MTGWDPGGHPWPARLPLTQARPLPKSAAALVLREAAAEYFRMAETSAVDPTRYLSLAADYHARALRLEAGI